MRVIAGKLKYKRLHYRKSSRLRPTRNIVRRSFFDTLMGLVEGSVFLDLFAGSGSVGMEALSRGAKRVIFVDNSRESISVLSKNTREIENADVIKEDAERFLESEILSYIDIAYIDPPYNYDFNGFLEKFFSRINKDAIVCVEHDKKIALKESFNGFKKIKTKTFGKNTLDYYGVENG